MQNFKGKFDTRFLITAGLFLFSGLSSLIYQVIWTRLLVFVFGSTTFATSTVLSVFMGGLALGSYLAGNRADRIKKPLLAYGILEFAIGVWALLTPVLFSAAIPIYKAFFESLHLQPIVFGMLRYAIASVILLLPTACMGATLPLLSRYVTESLEQVGDRVGTLYGINTLGAVLGSILGGFVLIPNLGLSMTTNIAAAINVLLMLAVLGISKLPSFAARNASIAESIEAAPKSEGEKLSPLVKATMISFGISGALAMIYEVAWTRALLMVIGSTTYAFTVMLSAFLVGIFAGSLIAARFVDKMKAPVIGFAIAEIVLSFFGLVALFTFNHLPYINLIAGIQLKESPDLTLCFRFFAAGLVLLPISLCLGMIFPLAVKVCAQDLARIGKSLGQLYSINTVGAIIGAFLAGFVVIPVFGTEQALVLTSLVNLLLGAVLLFMFSQLKYSIKLLTVATSIISIVVVSVNPPRFFDINQIVGAQSFRRFLINQPNVTTENAASIFNDLLADGSIEYYKEGKSANVAIRKSGSQGFHSLITNGHIDASDEFDMSNQAMLAALPLLSKPNNNDEVCVIGWGSGVTTGYALRFPIKEMVCSELEPVVIETSPFFHAVNFKPEEDKRCVIEPSDGRNYLLGTSKKFDAIISEPSNPWQAGVCNLFTKEYFQICKDGLKPGGVFTMWSQVSEIPTKDLRNVFSALHSAFPEVFIFDSGNGCDVVALAYPEKHKFNFEQVKKNIELPGVRDSLRRFQLLSAEDFFARLVATPNKVDGEIAGIEPNSDERNYLEYDIAKTYENKSFNLNNQDWLRSMHGAVWDYVDWGQMSDEDKAKEFLNIARSCVSYPALARSTRALDWAQESMKLKPSADALAFIADMHVSDRQFKNAEEVLAQGRKLYPTDARFFGLEGVMALKNCDYNKALSFLSDAVKIAPDNFNFRYYLALCYSNLNLQQAYKLYVPPTKTDPAKVIELCLKPADDQAFVKGKPQILALIADSYLKIGKPAQAISYLQRLLAISPNGYLTWRLLGRAYDAQNDWNRAAVSYSKSMSIAAKEAPAFTKRIQGFMDRKVYDLALREVQSRLDMNPVDTEALSYLAVLSSLDAQAKSFQQAMIQGIRIDLPKSPSESTVPAKGANLEANAAKANSTGEVKSSEDRASSVHPSVKP